MVVFPTQNTIYVGREKIPCRRTIISVPVAPHGTAARPDTRDKEAPSDGARSNGGSS